MAAGSQDLAQVRGTLVTIAAAAWLLIGVDTVSMGGSAGHGDAAAGGPLELVSLAAGLLLMLAAMMLPLLAAPVYHLWSRSLARRRGRVITLFVVGYFAGWLAAGGLLTAVAGTLRHAVPGPALAVVVASMLVWHTTPARTRCLNRTHSHPAQPAFGLAGDVAVLRFGLTHALWCIATCWALMLLTLVAGPRAEPVVMAAVAFWLVAERLERPAPPRWGLQIPTTVARQVLRGRPPASALRGRTRRTAS